MKGTLIADRLLRGTDGQTYAFSSLTIMEAEDLGPPTGVAVGRTVEFIPKGKHAVRVRLLAK